MIVVIVVIVAIRGKGREGFKTDWLCGLCVEKERSRLSSYDENSGCLELVT